ncbi:MAG: hypothetical protein ACKOHI_02180 [Phycisphaerales bacterium]
MTSCRPVSCVVPLALVALVSAGCGKDDAPSSAAAPTPGASTTPAVMPAPAASTPAPAPGAPADATAAGAQPMLVKVATIEGKDANDEFTRNVQVVQAQRQEIVRMNEAMNAAPEGAERDAMKAKLDEAVKKLDADNQLMAKTYGYSILRNYVRVPEKSEVFIVLTPEEAEKQPKPTDGSPPATTARVCVLADAQANQAFQSAVQSLQQLRQQAASLKVQLDAATVEKDKAYLQGQFDLALKQLNEANAAATKAYAFNLNRQYVMSIERSSLYVAATAEEAEKASKAAEGK